MTLSWVPYHNHTAFSLLDGCGRIDDFVARAKEIGLTSVGIADHGTCGGYIDFQILCEKQGIKPLFGIEVYVSPESMTLKGLSDEEKEAINDKDKIREETRKRMRNAHLVLIAKNDVGLKNIYNITTDSNVLGFYGRPRIDYDYLKKHSAGLICTTACMASKLNRYIIANDEAKINAEIEFLLDLFGNDLYFELNLNTMETQSIINKKLLELSAKFRVKYTFSTDAHYPSKDYEKAHAAIIKINSNSKWEFEAKDLYLMSAEEAFNYIRTHHSYITEEQILQGFKNSVGLSEKCNVKLDMKSKKYPVYMPPDGMTNNEYMIKLIQIGMSKRPINRNEVNKYLERIKFEFNIISNMGYIDYFLIVQDFINWSKQNGILIGPGRGSVGGSLIAWLIGITEVDPVKHNLSFVRFLNPDRLKAPDADTDIEDERRQDVRDYLAKKWGETCIAPIVALSRYSANNLFRDVCKQYDLIFSDYNAVAKTIDVEGDEYHKQKTFKQNLEENKQLQEFINKLGDKGLEIASIVDKLEGQTKNISIAAAGTIISNKPLKNIMPLRRTKEDKIITEWEGHKLEPAGYLKMDLLGLKTLTVIRKCLAIIGKDINFIYNLPFDDEKVYENFRAGKTEAIFQFEGKNITKVLTKIKPTELEHLSITSSLYRPGPIETGVIQHYIDRRNGVEPVEYMHPIFEEILKPTLGLVIYQEQVIDIYAKLGLTYGEGDLLRRYCEQKNRDKMEFYYNKIKSNSVLPKDELDKLMPLIEERIGYSFNRSHSIQYAIVSYWGMWLKTYYPEIFCTVNLNQNLEKHEKIAKYIDMTEKECKIHVDYCDFNHLSSMFNIEEKDGKKVMNFGYLCVKNISQESIDKINEYAKNYEPKTIKQILEDSDIHKIKKNVLETLIAVGALDNFDTLPGLRLNRTQLIEFYKAYLDVSSMTKKKLKESAFFEGDRSRVFTDPFLIDRQICSIKQDTKELIKLEFDLMGHCPLINTTMFEKNRVHIDNAQKMFGDKCRVGYISEITERNDKKKNKMCFIKLVDEYGIQTKCTVFSGLYKLIKDELQQFNLIVAVGEYSEQWNSLTVNKIITIC